MYFILLFRAACNAQQLFCIVNLLGVTSGLPKLPSRRHAIVYSAGLLFFYHIWPLVSSPPFPHRDRLQPVPFSVNQKSAPGIARRGQRGKAHVQMDGHARRLQQGQKVPKSVPPPDHT